MSKFVTLESSTPYIEDIAGLPEPLRRWIYHRDAALMERIEADRKQAWNGCFARLEFKAELVDRAIKEHAASLNAPPDTRPHRSWSECVKDIIRDAGGKYGPVPTTDYVRQRIAQAVKDGILDPAKSGYQRKK